MILHEQEAEGSETLRRAIKRGRKVEEIRQKVKRGYKSDKDDKKKRESRERENCRRLTLDK